jgi:hypothetical protein
MKLRLYWYTIQIRRNRPFYIGKTNLFNYANMKRFSIHIRFLIPFIFLFFWACEKEDPTTPPNINESPEISVTSPSAGNQFTLGQSISVLANVKDNKEIYELFVQLKNLNDNSITNISILHIHLATYNLNTSYTITSSTPPGNYSLILKATDFDNNSTETTVAITII